MNMPPVPTRVDLIVTHGGCHDGYTAEWLLHRRWPDANVHQGVYGEDITDLCQLGADIAHTAAVAWNADLSPTTLVMADFSYPLADMDQLAAAWDRIILFDHHQTAVETLDGRLAANVEYVFDMGRSGAGLVADWLAWRTPLVNYVEDGDLWRFDLLKSREIRSLIGATDRSTAAWTDLDFWLSRDLDSAVKAGALVRNRDRIICEDLTAMARPAWIGGHKVPAVLCPSALGSEVAGILADGQPFAAYYRDLPDRREFGLRSTPDGIDVAAVAEQYGGGGHRHAAGFRVEWDSEQHWALAATLDIGL